MDLGPNIEIFPLNDTDTKLIAVAFLVIVAAVPITLITGWMEIPNHSIPPHCLGQLPFLQAR